MFLRRRKILISLPLIHLRHNFGDRSFSAAGPWVWNNRPTDFRQPDYIYSRFRQSLTTFLFGRWDQTVVRIPL